MPSSFSTTSIIPENSIDSAVVKRKKKLSHTNVLKQNYITIFGVPIAQLMSNQLKDIMSVEKVTEIIVEAMKLSGINNFFTDEYMEKIAISAQDHMATQMLFDKKTISADTFTKMFSVLEHSLTAHQKRKISTIIQNVYVYIIEKYRDKVNIIKLGLYRNNPSVVTKYMYQEFGSGTYDEDGTWTYGKQNLPYLSVGKARFDSDIIHPIYGFIFSFFNIKNLDYNILSFSEHNEEKFFVNNRGIFASGERARFISFLRKNISMDISWERIQNGNVYVVSGKTSILGQKLQFFKITATYFQSVLTIDFYTDSGKKFAEIKTIAENIRPRGQVYDRSIEFLSEFIASEFAAYVYAATKGMMIPFMAHVIPNGSPWSALRNGGGISSAPVIGTGQLAMPISVVRDAAQPAVDFYGMEGLYRHNSNVLLARPTEKRSMNWNIFSNQICIDAHQENLATFSHLSSNFSIISEKTNNKGETKIIVNNESKEVIEERIIFHGNALTYIDIGMIALGNLLDVKGAPSWQDYSATVENLPYLFRQQNNDTSNIIETLEQQDITEEAIKYCINSSSLTLEKFPKVMTLHGNLTNTSKIFDSNVVQQEDGTSFLSSFDEIHARIQTFETSPEYNASSERFYSSKGISDSLYLLKYHLNNRADKTIPALRQVNKIGRPIRSESSSLMNYDLPIVEGQINGLCYVVRLFGEYIIENKKESVKAKSSISIDEDVVQNEHFQKMYEFKIMCNDAHGETLFVYDAKRTFSAEHLPILSSLGVIYTGYLPDFIAWVNTHGLNFYRAFITQNVQDAESKDFYVDESEFIPLYFDNTLCSSQGHVLREWLTKTFPSVADINLNVAAGQYSVLQHLIDSTSFVDMIRKDGYSPALEMNDSSKAKMLRAIMLFHDIGKISILDGGHGPFSENHGKVSASIAKTFLSRLDFTNEEVDKIVKFINYHDIIKNALEGKFGHLDEALSHVGRIAKNESEIKMFYHIYRCDNDSFPDYLDSGQKLLVSSKIFVSAEEFCDHLVQNTKLAQYSPISDLSQHISKSTFIFRDASKSVEDIEAEFVKKTNNFLSSAVIRQESIRTNSYNPEYYNKMRHMIEKMKKNPDLSFARSLGMSYEGATGSIVRGFLWTDPSILNEIFSLGLRKYFGSENRIIQAVINSPSPGKKSTSALFRHEDHPKLSAEAQAIIVFDYHVGNPIYHEELISVRQMVRSWKMSKMGRQLFSMNFDRYDIEEQSSIALSLGYSSIAKRIITSLNDPMPSISCLDLNRIALLTAYVIPNGVRIGNTINAIGQTYNSYVAYPAKIEVYGKNGNRSVVKLPALPHEEIFLPFDHTHFCVVDSGSSESIKIKQIGSGIGSPLIGKNGLWRGMPRISPRRT